MSSNPRYLPYDVDTDSQDIIQRAFDYLKTKNPNWEPSEGQLDTWILEAGASEASDVARLVQYVPTNIFRYYGGVLWGVPQIAAAYATATINIFAIDSLGHSFFAGMQIGIRDSVGNLIPFTLVNDAVIAPGQTHVDNVLVVAAVEGSASSGLGTVGGTVELIDTNQYVDHITQATVSAGGADAETDDEYNSRLSQRLQLMSPRPITASDYAILARDIAGVQRATAIDGYNPYYNILSANQSSAETDASGWYVGANVTLGSTAAQAADGSKSVAMTSIAAGSMEILTPTLPPPGAGSFAVKPGDIISGIVNIRAAATPRSSWARLRFYNSVGTVILTVEGTAANDSTTAWTQYLVQGTAPTNAAYVTLSTIVTGIAGAGEVHYADKALLGKGVNTTWVIGPATATNQERMVTVIALDSTGTGVGSTTKTAIANYLDALRELNFIVNMADPSVNQVDVTSTFIVAPDYNLADTQSRVISAIRQYLDPRYWGVARNDNLNDPSTWVNTTTIYYLELAQIINGVPGVDRVQSLTLGPHSGTLTAADYALTGAAPIPNVITVNATGSYA